MFVSAAAGAVGQVVCQIAKLKGHTVIGSAGGPEKVAYLKEIGVDHAIDYKAEPDLTAALMRAAPGGIDVYFENVGGAHMEAALMAAKPFAPLRALRHDRAATTPPTSARASAGLMMAVGKQLAPAKASSSPATATCGPAFRREFAELGRRGQDQVARDGRRGHRARARRLPQAVQGREPRQDAGKAGLELPPSRHPPLERSGMRGTHEHSRFPVIMGRPDKPGDDELIIHLFCSIYPQVLTVTECWHAHASRPQSSPPG